MKLPVKMQVTRDWTEDPMELYCNLSWIPVRDVQDSWEAEKDGYASIHKDR